MTFIIRLASKKDISALADLRCDFCAEDKHHFDKKRSISLFTEILNNNSIGTIFVAVSADETIAGYAVVVNTYSLEFDGHDAWLDELYIAPSYRHNKIGSQLIENAVALCKQTKLSYLHLEAMDDNTKVHAYYSKHGFNPRRSKHYVMPLKNGIPSTVD